MTGFGSMGAPGRIGLGAGGGKMSYPQPEPKMGELAAPFYSAAEQTVAGAKQAAAPGPQWLGTLRNAPGVKPEELQRLGIEPWLARAAGRGPQARRWRTTSRPTRSISGRW